MNMNCPLCGKELIQKSITVAYSGEEVWFLACPVIFRKKTTLEKVCWFSDHNHYQLWDNKAEVAYVYPYRIHNVLNENYCEVSDCSDRIHEGTAVLFNCPFIKFTSEDKLKQRIDNLLLFL